MAKREISSTLRSLKFMQRAVQKEEKKTEEEVKPPEGNFFSASTVRKCVVVMEGDPHPGAVRGRMSFLSFNPAIDKLNEEAADLRHPDTSATVSGNQSKQSSLRENESSGDGAGGSVSDKPNAEANGNLKRKQSGVDSESPYPNKSPKSSEGDQQSAPQNGKSSRKQSKHERLDWNVLRQSKNKNKRS